MDDGPVEHLQAFKMVQLLKPATEEIEKLVKPNAKQMKAHILTWAFYCAFCFGCITLSF